MRWKSERIWLRRQNHIQSRQEQHLSSSFYPPMPMSIAEVLSPILLKVLRLIFRCTGWCVQSGPASTCAMKSSESSHGYRLLRDLADPGHRSLSGKPFHVIHFEIEPPSSFCRSISLEAFALKWEFILLERLQALTVGILRPTLLAAFWDGARVHATQHRQFQPPAQPISSSSRPIVKLAFAPPCPLFGQWDA